MTQHRLTHVPIHAYRSTHNLLLMAQYRSTHNLLFMTQYRLTYNVLYDTT